MLLLLVILGFPIPTDNKLCHFWSYNAVRNEAYFVLTTTPLEIGFLPYVILGNLKSLPIGLS